MLVLISTLLHFKHFSKEIISVHVWRQTQTQTTINNFYEEDMNIFNPRQNERGNETGIHRLEFPLMQYIVACIYKVFGQHLIISRLFMFLTGIFSLLGFYTLLFYLFKNINLALIGVWAFNFSPSFFYYTINPLPDNFALCCSIWGIALFFRWLDKQQKFYLLSSGFLMALGALCKLPFILYFIVPLSYFLIQIKETKINKSLIINALKVGSFAILPISWYAWVIPQWSNGVVTGIATNDLPSSTILDFIKNNLISTLPELLLNYAAVPLFLASFYFIFQRKSYKNKHFTILASLGILLLAYFFFEINMIANVHDYYLFPFFPLLFTLVAFGGFHLINSKKIVIKYFTLLLLCLLPITAYLRMQSRWNLDNPGFNKDLLDHKEALRNAVPKDALCIVGNDESRFIFFYYVDKKGWVFCRNELDAPTLQNHIAKGAKFLYSDTRNIDENPTITPFLEKLILEKGSIKIFQLKQ